MQALCQTLKDHGYETAGFSSPATALEELKKTEYDLLLTDLTMPEMDGITLLQAALESDPNLVGIIMTARGTTLHTAVEAMKSGASDYLLKPFDWEAIEPVLSRARSMRKLRLENAALLERVSERTAEIMTTNMELDAFAHSVSHDLRAPVRHISGFADLLAQEEPGLSEPGKRYLGLIRQATRHMSQLIDDLLSFSRNNRAELRRRRIDLNELLEKVILLVRPEMEGRNIVWKKHPLPTVAADLTLLQQVFINLILNAIKYTRKRDPAEIEIGAQAGKPGEVVIFIRDNGVGFDMKYVDRLFGMFQRLHKQEDFEGTGIGLANVRRIIARHGGRTWTEGTVNGGAVFYFSLPGDEGKSENEDGGLKMEKGKTKIG